MTPTVIVAVLVAGAVGTVIRWALSKLLAGKAGLPLAVLFVNVVGSAVAGMLLAQHTTGTMSDGTYLVLLTGFCGGLTTFSTFSVDTIQLALAGRIRIAALNALANLALGIAAAWLAFAITIALLPPTAYPL